MPGLGMLFPARCTLCMARIPRGRPRLCTECLKKTMEWDGVCRTLGDGTPCIAASRYAQTVGAVRRFKFNGRRDYAPDFARLMALAWVRQRRARPDIGAPDAVTWVPVSFLRRLKRGYDQSELLARELGRILELPVVPLLRKRRHTPRQSRLRDDEARRRNVRGAYGARSIPEGLCRVLLVDDVVTSGATLCEAAGTLRERGVECMALCFAAGG